MDQDPFAGNVWESLHRINNDGILPSKEEFINAIKGGSNSFEYRKLISYLSNELLLLEGKVKNVIISKPEYAIEKVMESKAFLHQLGRIHTFGYKLFLIEHLCIRITCARMTLIQQAEERLKKEKRDADYVAEMTNLFATLDLPLSSKDAYSNRSMQKVIECVKDRASSTPGSELLGDPLLDGLLSKDQWEALEPVLEMFNNDFTVRRQMILLRLDITIQAFLDKEQSQDKVDAIRKIYTEKLDSLESNPNINMSDLLSSRDDLLVLEKVTSSRLRKNTKCALNDIIIGEVPHRGGNVMAPVSFENARDFKVFIEDKKPATSVKTGTVPKNRYPVLYSEKRHQRMGYSNSRANSVSRIQRGQGSSPHYLQGVHVSSTTYSYDNL